MIYKTKRSSLGGRENIHCDGHRSGNTTIVKINSSGYAAKIIIHNNGHRDSRGYSVRTNSIHILCKILIVGRVVIQKSSYRKLSSFQMSIILTFGKICIFNLHYHLTIRVYTGVFYVSININTPKNDCTFISVKNDGNV